MVNQCANPNCRKPLHYLREGRVFLFSPKNSSPANHKSPHRLEHFWLCGDCAQIWTLEMDSKDGVNVKLVENKSQRFRASYAASPFAPAS